MWSESDAFLQALRDCDLVSIKRLIARSPQGNAANVVKSSKQPTIHYLLQHRDADRDPAELYPCILALQDFGADLTAVCPFTGNSALHYVVLPTVSEERGVSSSAKLPQDSAALLWFFLSLPSSSCPSLLHRNRDGWNVLEAACRYSNIAAVDGLFTETMKAGPTVEERYVSLPLAIYLSMEDRCSHVQRLLTIACRYNQVAMVRFFLTSPTMSLTVTQLQRLDATGNAAAAVRSQETTLGDPQGASNNNKQSLFLPWNVHSYIPWQLQDYTRDEGGPFRTACSFGALDVVQFLLHWASHQTTTEEDAVERSRTEERYHAHIPKQVPAAVLRLLHEEDLRGRSALHYAADGRCMVNDPVMAALLAVDPRLVERRDKGGRTALDAALKGGRKQNAEWLLLKYGATAIGKTYK